MMKDEPSQYEKDMRKRSANHVALTPLDFLTRTATVFPDRTAVIYADRHTSYREFRQRVHRLGSALKTAGVGRDDTVSVLAPNVPALLEAHYGVPLCGGVLNAINTRLDARTVRFILEHAQARVFLVERSFHEVAHEALAGMNTPPLVIDIVDPHADTGEAIGSTDYETFLTGGDEDYAGEPPADEWQALSLNYTSGTTGDPKGVVYTHRGAYLNAVGNVLGFLQMSRDAFPVYLWSLPMFHCNGWTYPWAVTLAGGTHVCLREVRADAMFRLIAEHGVTHMCGAPIVLNMLMRAPDSEKRSFSQGVEVATGGAAPPSSILSGMESMGFRVTHLYGLTETYGPSIVCEWQSDWQSMALEERAALISRQGVGHCTVARYDVIGQDSLQPVPADGETLGELVIRSNTVMKGYLKNSERSEEALADGWFRTGDLGVMHPDRYVEIKDRTKDVIISGGENISSLEVEEALYRHAAVNEAAVVAKPDEKWGETPCAFVDVVDGESLSEQEVIDWCREQLAHFKAPRRVVFGELPKTSTGKVQKYVLREQAAGLEST